MKLIIVDDFDITPEIHYDKKGRANKVKTYTVFDENKIGESAYGLTDKGIYTEWHYDPEHGGSLQPEQIDISRLRKLAEDNPHIIPAHLVLGQRKKRVEDLLLEREIIKVKHIAA